MNHQIEAHIEAAAGCAGLAGRQMSIGAALVAQGGSGPPSPKPVASPPAAVPVGTINLGVVNLRPHGR